jgi:hypothetical protein
MHSFDSWKQGSVEKIISNIEKGQPNPPKYQFSRNETQIKPSGWVQCEQCRRYVCEVCLQAIIDVLPSPSVYGVQNFQENKWCQIMVAFCNAQYDHHELFYKIMRVPGCLSHCCGLKLSAEKQIAIENDAIIQYLKNQSGNQDNQYASCSLDGLLHYSPYRAVFAASNRYFECLAAAEQENRTSSLHQNPVFHSVISNRVAHEYETKNIRPIAYKNGSESFANLVIDDCVFDVQCCVIEEDKDGAKRFVSKTINVRRILLKRSTDYVYKEEKRGDCPLNDPNYFCSCTMLFNKQWEEADSENNVDVVMVTGEPDAKDRGKTEILLSCRVLMKSYEIPNYSDDQLNHFFDVALAKLDKAAYEIRRRGGSGGFPVADQDFLDYHREFRTCLPVIAGAAIHLPMMCGNWMAVYISPYKQQIHEAVKSFQYSPPRKGGQLDATPETTTDLLPEFFLRMAMVRHLVPSVLHSLHIVHRVMISPIARDNQMRYALMAEHDSPTTNDIFHQMAFQVTYSLVGYTVGSHKDVTHSGCEQEFIECKGMLVHPSECVGMPGNTALGRGGMGSGVYTYMIVDHPKKKS